MKRTNSSHYVGARCPGGKDAHGHLTPITVLQVMDHSTTNSNRLHSRHIWNLLIKDQRFFP